MLISLFYPISILVSIEGSQIRRIENLWQNLSLGAALLLTSWSIFLKVWTYDNGFMPACAGLGMLAGLGYGRVLKLTQRSLWRGLDSLFRGGVLVLLLCQFAALFYNPLEQLSTNKDREAAEQFISRLSDLPGEVLVFNHGFVNYMAGKNTYLHSAPYGDVVGGVHPPRTEDYRWRREKVRQVFEQAVTQQAFDWIIVDKPAASWLPYYIYVDNLFDDPEVFYPVTGAPARPESIMLRNPVVRGGVLPLTDVSFDSLLSEGWSIPEDWGRWAVGKRSVVRVALEQEHDYRLTIEAFPFCPPQFAGQAMKVGWNDLSLGRYIFLSCECHLITFDVPSEAVTEGLNDLWFEFEKAVSPADVGLSGDRRPLAVGFTSITLVQKER